MKEDEIKKAISESKKPSMKIYLAVLVMAVVLIGLYALFSGGADVVSFTEKITSPSQAQEKSDSISNGIHDISTNMDDISHTLGIS